MNDAEKDELEKRINKAVNREWLDVKATLEANDDLISRILRFHLVTENQFERLICLALPRGDRLIDRSRLNYSQKLELVNALDRVSEATIASLRQLNRLRNECAHNRHATVSEEQLEAIGRPFAGRFAELKKYADGNLTVIAYAAFLSPYFDLLKAILMEEDRRRREDPEAQAITVYSPDHH